MSKDFITIAIVILCIAALIFLIIKTVNLSSSTVSEPGEDSNYLYDDDTADGGMATDTTTTLDSVNNGPSTDLEERIPTPSPEYSGKDEIVPRDDQEGINTSPKTPASFSESGDYLVLAGSFRIKSNAEKEARRLQRLGYNDAEIALFNRGTYASVIVGRYSDLNSANQAVRELKSRHGVEAYVQTKRGTEN